MSSPKKAKSSLQQAGELSIRDPPSKISTKRWKRFLSDIHEESSTFSGIQEQTLAASLRSNQEYAKCEQVSFNAIHNVTRKPPLQDTGVPRVKKPKEPVTEPKKTYDPFEYAFRISNSYVFPVRKNSAQRIFNPVKLQDYPNLKRKKDIPVVGGEVVTDPLLI